MEISPNPDAASEASSPNHETPAPSPDDNDAGWTPLKFLIALVLAVTLGVIGAGFGLVWRGDLRSPKEPYNPLLASLKAPDKATLGSKIWVTFEVVNQGRKPISVVDHSERSERQDQYEVIVRLLDEDLPLPMLPPEGNGDLLPPPPLIKLEPGQKASWRLDITRYVKIDKAGAYKVTVARHPFVDEIRVKAPPITFEIQ